MVMIHGDDSWRYLLVMVDGGGGGDGDLENNDHYLFCLFL